ncbi:MULTISPECIES: ABC transporter permease [unclassified Adlercreutzia]|uniref:ABC transporter permease n=1 Tax=unclassified Adlercreutzia TaxID=2636013 RepID=UPI0013EDC7D8|nr:MULTISPECIES: ABC transporter permease [unclassified Adlercreutzia]
MANTFKYVLLSLLRNKGILVWGLAFPIVLSCCFMMMFQGLDDVAEGSTIRTVVVEDAAYEESVALPQFIDAISSEDAILDVYSVENEQQAKDVLNDSENAEDPYVGYITADSAGLPVVHLQGGNRSNSASMIEVYQSILVTLMDSFCNKNEIITSLMKDNPALMSDPAFIESLIASANVTEKIDVTENAPRESVRYYFALLGMASMFGAQAGLVAVGALLPNTSALGARRALGGTSRVRSLFGCILASWLMSFCCLLVAFLFMRYAVGVDFGTRNLSCIAVLAASSLMATALGSLIGSIPKVSIGAKSGILTGIVCFASFFAGLYGQPTMQLADDIAVAFPASQYINPAVQVSQAMFSLMYYDTLIPCMQHLAILAIMAVVFFLVAARFLGRQRYASL